MSPFIITNISISAVVSSDTAEAVEFEIVITNNNHVLANVSCNCRLEYWEDEDTSQACKSCNTFSKQCSTSSREEGSGRNYGRVDDINIIAQ